MQLQSELTVAPGPNPVFGPEAVHVEVNCPPFSRMSEAHTHAQSQATAAIRPVALLRESMKRLLCSLLTAGNCESNQGTQPGIPPVLLRDRWPVFWLLTASIKNQSAPRCFEDIAFSVALAKPFCSHMSERDELHYSVQYEPRPMSLGHRRPA